jgi:hypothetical protein
LPIRKGIQGFAKARERTSVKKTKWEQSIKDIDEKK